MLAHVGSMVVGTASDSKYRLDLGIPCQVGEVVVLQHHPQSTAIVHAIYAYHSIAAELACGREALLRPRSAGTAGD